MKSRILLSVFIAGIILNVAGYFFADFIKIYIKLPLFMDSTGTIFTAVILGPFIGALTGLTSNLIAGILHNPVNIPFSVVNMIIGITAGIISKRYGFSSFKTLSLLITSVTILSAFSGAVIAYFVFGGVTGAKIDLNIITFMNAGYKLFTSSFLLRLPANIADKGLSILIAFFLIGNMNPDHQGYAVKK